jgi:N-acetylglucosaminyl-diphospho-decaprenol L-rhamnosyltransferase
MSNLADTDASANSLTITVVVLNYNSGAYLAACLEALMAQSHEKFCVIIADNGSTDNSFTGVQATISDARFAFVEFGLNHGFARGNNLSMQKVDTPLVVLLNPDAVPAPDWLERLDAAQQAYPNADSFGSLQLDFNDPGRLDGAGDNYLAVGVPWRGGHGHDVSTIPKAADGEVFSACAAAALYRTAVFKAAGGFDEDYFCYVEDVDLGFRLRLFGGACMQIQDAVVRHVGGVSSGSKRSEFAIYHGVRNMIWTFVKNMPGPLFWLLFPAHIVVLAVLLAKACVRGEGAIVARGIRDAAGGMSSVWAKRRLIQARRKASVTGIAAALAWNIGAYFGKKIICRNVT